MRDDSTDWLGCTPGLLLRLAAALAVPAHPRAPRKAFSLGLSLCLLFQLQHLGLLLLLS